jgi:FKBP-type peptidyl-prolyl cis-trans isomerase 2
VRIERGTVVSLEYELRDVEGKPLEEAEAGLA